MSAHRVKGIEDYQDLVKRFDHKLGLLLVNDNCGGCKIRDLVVTFQELVKKRQKRDKDFSRR